MIFSHSSARAIADHPRNVPDDVLRLMAGNGGVVMYPIITQELLQRGYTAEEIHKVLSGNILRAMEHVEAAAGQ